MLALDPQKKGDRLRSSLAWLRKYDVITEQDQNRFFAIKRARTEAAHELTGILTGEKTPRFDEHFSPALALIKKIERWWILNVEIPTNPDFLEGEKEIDEDGIEPMRVIVMQLLVDVALGDEERAGAHLNMFRDFVAAAKKPLN